MKKLIKLFGYWIVYFIMTSALLLNAYLLGLMIEGYILTFNSFYAYFLGMLFFTINITGIISYLINLTLGIIQGKGIK